MPVKDSLILTSWSKQKKYIRVKLQGRSIFEIIFLKKLYSCEILWACTKTPNWDFWMVKNKSAKFTLPQNILKKLGFKIIGKGVPKWPVREGDPPEVSDRDPAWSKGRRPPLC